MKEPYTMIGTILDTMDGGNMIPDQYVSRTDGPDTDFLDRYRVQIRSDNTELIQQIIDTDPYFVCMVGSNMTTPLIIASSALADNVVRLLLSNGANPDSRTHNGSTALHVAVN